MENGSRIIVCVRQIVGILIGNSDKIFQTMEYSSSKLQTQYNEFINFFRIGVRKEEQDFY